MKMGCISPSQRKQNLYAEATTDNESAKSKHTSKGSQQPSPQLNHITLELSSDDVQSRLHGVNRRKSWKKQCQDYRRENDSLRNEVEKQAQIIAEQRNTILELEAKYNETLTRLSALASSRLTDGNANIADLSDENRPTKLAEKFCELYDNEWTNAFEYLTEAKTFNEDVAISTLLKALCAIYKYCKERAEADYISMASGIHTFLATKDQEIPKDIMKSLKDARKKNFRGHFASVEEKVKEHVKKQFTNDIDWDVKATKDYLRESLELCWLMVIQDPPVYMDTDFSTTNEQFNSNIYKQYTKSGTTIDFIVWPALYLCENGSLLSKGVVQGKDFTDSPETEVTHL